MVLFDDEVQLIHDIDIPDENMTVNDENGNIMNDIINDGNDPDRVHEDGQFLFDFFSSSSKEIIRDYLKRFIFPKGSVSIEWLSVSRFFLRTISSDP